MATRPTTLISAPAVRFNVEKSGMETANIKDRSLQAKKGETHVNPRNRNDVIFEWVKALNEGNAQAILELTTPDFKARFMGTGPSWFPHELSRQDLASSLAGLQTMFQPPLTLTIKSVLVDEDRASFEATSDTKTINGRVYANRYHFAVEFRGDKIIESREYCCSYLIENVLSELAPNAEQV
jgi:ketosteroid isomerase-like protein